MYTKLCSTDKPSQNPYRVPVRPRYISLSTQRGSLFALPASFEEANDEEKVMGGGPTLLIRDSVA